MSLSSAPAIRDLLLIPLMLLLLLIAPLLGTPLVLEGAADGGLEEVWRKSLCMYRRVPTVSSASSSASTHWPTIEMLQPWPKLSLSMRVSALSRTGTMRARSDTAFRQLPKVVKLLFDHFLASSASGGAPFVLLPMSLSANLTK
jgi:hypothetical protein